MNMIIVLWSFAVFLASAFAVALVAVTLTPKYKKAVTLQGWGLAALAGYAAAYVSYSINLTNDAVGILGLMVIVCAVTHFLYKGSWSSKLFVSLTACMIANVSTFMFCGTTDSLLGGPLGLIKESPYEVPNLLFFIVIKLVVYSIIFQLYRKYMQKKVTEMIEALAGKLDSFIAAPAVSVVGFYIINLFTNVHGIYPSDFWFFPLYLTVCCIFVIEFRLIFDSVLQSARAMKNAAELNVATNIQKSMLPSIFPAFPGRPEFDIYATMTPAKEVGGDFYDFFLVDDAHLAMVMADVSGKGVPAALFMMIAKTLIKNTVQTGLSPKAVLEKVNNQLCENNDAEMFVTVWLGIMEIATGKMVCANAGHEYPAIKRKDGGFELFMDKHGFVLAGMEGVSYTEYEMELKPGDAIYVYTDGVAEATNAQYELYGTDRMIEALNAKNYADCKELLEAIHADINRFVGDAPQFDDITMLCLEMKGRENT